MPRIRTGKMSTCLDIFNFKVYKFIGGLMIFDKTLKKYVYVYAYHIMLY